MARINTNISSVVAQSNLAKSSKELSLRFERLSTGLRINRGADDPAGLIVSERIKSDIQGINSGVKNSERASSVIATTEAALNEVSELLNSIKSLMVEAANTGANSPEERNANQLQIDSALDSITRISNTASFGGLKLLNGSLDYTLSGMKASAITKAQVWNASLVNQSNLQVTVDVVASAQKAGLYYNPGTTNPGRLLSAMSLEVTGSNGVQTFQFPVSATLSSVVAAVNNTSTFTGVTAALINNNVNSGIVFRSEGYGSDEFVSVRRIGAPSTGDSWQTYNFVNNAPPALGSPAGWAALSGAGTIALTSRDNGKDVQALINGALATGRGLAIGMNTSSLGVDMVLNEDFATRPAAANSVFNITGGGALFQLGQDITAQQQTNLGIPSMASSYLGGTLVNGTVQYVSSLKTGQGFSIADSVRSGDFTQANAILDKAIDEVSTLRGRLGAFERNVLQTNVRSLQSAFENLSASNSQIRDADFAQETSNLTRAQILSSSGTSVLGLANQQSQQVLQLLG
jgi:flagellin